jgi:hypothetical protein
MNVACPKKNTRQSCGERRPVARPDQPAATGRASHTAGLKRRSVASLGSPLLHVLDSIKWSAQMRLDAVRKIALSHPKAQTDLQHLVVEEDQGIERLVLGRGGHMPIQRQMADELADFFRTHFRRVSRAVEIDEPFDPADVTAVFEVARFPGPQPAPCRWNRV